MTPEQIQQIREKYKNPLYMQNAINNVAGILADEYIKQEMKVEVDGGKKKMEKTEIKKTRFEELELVLLNQIEMLNDESILTDKESATIAIEKSKAISALAGNFTELQKTKLDIVKTAMQDRGVYDNSLGNSFADFLMFFYIKIGFFENLSKINFNWIFFEIKPYYLYYKNLESFLDFELIPIIY